MKKRAVEVVELNELDSDALPATWIRQDVADAPCEFCSRFVASERAEVDDDPITCDDCGAEEVQARSAARDVEDATFGPLRIAAACT
jgi:hypothetical protein